MLQLGRTMNDSILTNLSIASVAFAGRLVIMFFFRVLNSKEKTIGVLLI